MGVGGLKRRSYTKGLFSLLSQGVIKDNCWPPTILILVWRQTALGEWP